MVAAMREGNPPVGCMMLGSSMLMGMAGAIFYRRVIVICRRIFISDRMGDAEDCKQQYGEFARELDS